MVRYGNVMGSRGSVIPFFMSIRDRGVLPITDARQEKVGIRPGKKLHEQMVGREDAPYTCEYDEHFKILPAIDDWSRDEKRIKNGAPVGNAFVYASDTNAEWIPEAEFAAWIEANRDRIGAI